MANGNVHDDAPQLDTILFKSALLEIGSFRANADHPRFQDSGPIRKHKFVFPRTGCIIQHQGEPPFPTDPGVVTYYNCGQLYRRQALSKEGHRCEWFAFRPDLLIDAIALHDPTAQERPHRPFPFSHGPSDAGSYALQRLVVDRLFAEDDEVDNLAVEEVMLRVLGRVTRLAYERDSPPSRSDGNRDRERQRRDARLAQRVRRVLVDRFHEPLSLDDIAAHARCSVYHLCRAFKRSTGTTIHRYRNQLRLRRSLELVPGSVGDLTAVAMGLGYSSHSHFTVAFHRAFSMTPSAYSRIASTRQVRALAETLGGSTHPAADFGRMRRV